MPFDNTPSRVTMLFHLQGGQFIGLFVDLFVDPVLLLVFKNTKKVPKSKKKHRKLSFPVLKSGGRYRTRTYDLPHVKRML